MASRTTLSRRSFAEAAPKHLSDYQHVAIGSKHRERYIVYPESKYIIADRAVHSVCSSMPRSPKLSVSNEYDNCKTPLEVLYLRPLHSK